MTEHSRAQAVFESAHAARGLLHREAFLAREVDQIFHESGFTTVTPYPLQDSSMVSVLARSDALIVRAPEAPAAQAGALVEILFLDQGVLGI